MDLGARSLLEVNRQAAQMSGERRPLTRPLARASAVWSPRVYDTLLLMSVYLTFASLFLSVNIIIAFFPRSQPGTTIGSGASGGFFSSYLFATAVSVPLPPLVQRCLGGPAQLTAVGLAVSIAGTLSVGLAGTNADLLSSPTTLGFVLIVSRAVSGVGAAHAEAGAFALAIGRWPYDFGKVSSSIEMVIGIFMLVGSAIGVRSERHFSPA